MEEEAIYTLDQLLDAFQSSLDGLDEQLQLLRILDADAAPSWPGMDQAVFALRQSSAQVAAKCSEQSETISGQNRDVDSLKHENVVLSDRLQVSEKDNRMLRSKLSFLEKEIERHEVTKSEDDLTISDLKQNFSELGDKHAATLEYKRNLEETLNGKEKELEECQKMIEEQDEAHQGTLRKLEMQKSKSDELNISLKQSEAACEARIHDLHQSRVQCEELVRSKAQLTEELRQKKLTLEQTQQTLMSTESELERLKQWHVWLKQAEQERIGEQRDKHQKHVESLVSQINDMKVAKERIASQHTTEKASREVMESQMHKLEQDAWVRASELKSLHKEHETLVEDNKRLSQQAEQLRLAKDKLIEDKTQVMMRLAEVESELKKTGTEGKLEVASVRSQHKADLNEAEKVSKILQAEKEALTRELHRLQDEHDACHQHLAKCKRDLTHAKDEVDRLTQEKMRLEGELKSTQQTLDRSLQRMQRQSAASAAEINRLKNIQDTMLDSQLAQERHQRLRHRHHRPRQPQVLPEEDEGSTDRDGVPPGEVELHLEAAKEEESVENHALNRVKRLLQEIENGHRSNSPVQFK